MAIGERKPTKRELDAMETKSKIFSTAITLFSKYGYDKVTVDDITKYAGVSKGNFYNHFASKESVLVEQFHRIDNYYESAFQSVPEGTPASEQLLLLIETMSSYCTNVCGVNVMKIVYINQIGIGEKENILIETDHRTFYSIIRRIVDLGIDSGEFKADIEKEVLVEYIARFSRSLIYDWCLYDGARDLGEMGREFFGHIITWLAQ